MDKTAIKNYALTARRKLIEAVRQKAFQLYIFEDGALPPDEAVLRLRNDGIFLTHEQSKARLQMVSELAKLGHTLDNQAAYQHVMEEVAYTWFNRLIALRFMEVNEYLPSGIRILSSLDKGRIEPDAMREAERLDYVDQTKIAELRADTGNNASEKLYKYILISQCNALSAILPGMFEKINDYTELLLPDSLFTRGGIVYDLINAISEDNFHDQVQIIGWLYQYYISEKKDEVFADLKKNVKINKETIPAATQLFTPEWIVKYMVENSLGRLWLEQLETKKTFDFGHIDFANFSFGEDEDKSITKKQQNLKSNWKYYIDEAEQEDEVKKQLYHLRMSNKQYDIKKIKLIDPCMGSGHILVYAFDVFYQIYLSQDYAESEIPNLILANNIYGLDIDDRAGQLAYFALMMKARSYNRRFFRQEHIPQPMVRSIPETVTGYLAGADAVFGAHMQAEEKKACFDDLMYLVKLFENGKEYGSAMKIERELDIPRLKAYVYDQIGGQMTLEMTEMLKQVELLDRVIDVAAALSQKYDVVVTNPPYMGSGGMGEKLLKYAQDNYPNSKADLFAIFIETCADLLAEKGLLAMITMQSWMSLPSFEKMRVKLIDNSIIETMAHLGPRAFDEISGEVVQTSAFVIAKERIQKYKGTYICLINGENESKKRELLLSGKLRFVVSQDLFSSIPHTPVVYDISEKALSVFAFSHKFKDYAIARPGMQTSDNDRFLRFWYEVQYFKIGFDLSRKESIALKNKWFPYNKGIGYRKWYGNNNFIVNYYNDGEELKHWLVNNPNDPSTRHWSRNMRNYDYYFCEGITYTAIGDMFSARQNGKGYLFDTKGPTIFGGHLEYLCGFINTKVFDLYNRILCKQLTKSGDSINLVPTIIAENNNLYNLIESSAKENINIARNDWDSFETSWDFKTHPLIAFKGNREESEPLLYADDLSEGSVVTEWSKTSPPIQQAYSAWERFTYEQFDKLKANEEELNRIFIDIYGLQDELTPEVEDKDVEASCRHANLQRDIRSFLSYAVGCMFGRYSLDEPGLVYAGGQFEMSRYKTFLPEDDNIIPIGSADYFDDDIVERFTDFIRKVYGDDTLGGNLNFIADALYPNGSGSAKEKIRRYFLNDFYKDHLKIYQKRPIYWLLDSGKKDGFKALFYLHRYDKYTIARARTDYLHPLQRKYEAEINRLDMLSVSTDNAREKAAYRKEVETLKGKVEECQIYDQVVAHIAHQQIELDLDDGVKVNYEKFQGVEVPKDSGKTEKMDLLAKI